MKKKLEQAIEYANETNPGSRNGTQPGETKKSKKRKTHATNKSNEI